MVPTIMGIAWDRTHDLENEIPTLGPLSHQDPKQAYGRHANSMDNGEVQIKLRYSGYELSL